MPRNELRDVAHIVDQLVVLPCGETNVKCSSETFLRLDHDYSQISVLRDWDTLLSPTWCLDCFKGRHDSPGSANI